MALKNQTPTAWFWRLMAPLFTIIAYTILFEQVAKVDYGAGGIPAFFVISAAMIPWTLFSTVVLFRCFMLCTPQPAEESHSS